MRQKSLRVSASVICTSPCSAQQLNYPHQRMQCAQSDALRVNWVSTHTTTHRKRTHTHTRRELACHTNLTQALIIRSIRIEFSLTICCQCASLKIKVFACGCVENSYRLVQTATTILDQCAKYVKHNTRRKKNHTHTLNTMQTHETTTVRRERSTKKRVELTFWFAN